MTRRSGATRIETAVAVSQDAHGPDRAGAVVLARADLYPDALVGGPLAATVGGPLLLTPTAELPAAVLAEIERVLPPGGTVHVLGGNAAIEPAVSGVLDGFGYRIVRHGGADRYTTAINVADAIERLGGDIDTALIATGTNFPDALSASAAGAHRTHPVLLTNGDLPAAPTGQWLTTHRPAETVCVGGPACRAHPTSTTSLTGADRYATAVAVAEEFFAGGTPVGVASGVVFPDALVAAADTPYRGGPLVLTRPDRLPAATKAFVSDWEPMVIIVYGGTAAVSEAVAAELAGG